MSNMKKWMLIMEDAAPSSPKADLSKPESPMDDDPKFTNEKGEESVVTHMAEDEYNPEDDMPETSFEEWLYDPQNNGKNYPEELMIADIRKHGPDASAAYWMATEEQITSWIESGQIDSDSYKYWDDVQEEKRYEMHQAAEDAMGGYNGYELQQEEIKSPTEEVESELGPEHSDNPQAEEDMENDDGELSPFSLYAESVSPEDELAEMLSLAGVEQVQEDEFDDEEELEVDDDVMVDLGDDDEIDAIDPDAMSADKEMGDARIGGAPENVDELIQAIIDAQLLGISQAKATY